MGVIVLITGVDNSYIFQAPVRPGQTAYLVRAAAQKAPYLSNVKIEETKIEQVIFTEKDIRVKFGCNSSYQTSVNTWGKTWSTFKSVADEIFNKTVKKAKLL